LAKKKKSAGKILLTNIAILIAAAVSTYYVSNYFNKTRFVHYSGFDIDLPTSYSIHGIDVSRHQSSINWEDVKTMKDKNVQIGFVFIKATEGNNNVDDKFRVNWMLTKATKIPRGAYHFFNSRRSGETQAQNFINTVTLQAGDLPPVLDVETIYGTSKKDLQQRVVAWLTMVEKHYKVKPIIYTNAVFYETYLAEVCADYPLWVAHYLVKDKPRISRNWVMWQHSEKGHVNGIDAYVDFNAFNGDSSDFKKLLLK
jgi:lysozyme